MLATILLLLGLFLLGLEFFIPSFGMILAVAIVSLIVSFWSAWKAWWGVNPGFFWTYVVVLIAGIPGALLCAITIMQKTSLGNRLILRPPPPVEKNATNSLDELIGQQGTTQNLLTPGGMVLIGSERFHAESLGMLIEPHTPVVVIATRSNRIVVRPWTADDEKLLSSSVKSEKADSRISEPVEHKPQQSDATENGDRLDFEIPGDYTQTS